MSSSSRASTPVIDKKEDPQDVVFYCESRFRAMLNALEHADEEKKDWILDGIRAEIVSTKFRIT
jgi:hypothetical protein